MEFHSLLNLIEEYDVITIFRHERPDCDALGSQFGLKQWLNDNYPEKKIYAVGNESSNQGSFPSTDYCSDEIINSSLAIILDTASLDRIDDKRAACAQHILKIDHHPNVSPYGNAMYVDEKAAATCEILALFFSSIDRNLSKTCAEYLYSGLLTDTLCFRTSNTTASTLSAAACLAKTGIDIPLLNRNLFDQTLERFRFASFFRSKTQIENGHLAYVLITLEDQKKFAISGGDARNFIDEIGHVKEFEIWCAFTERTEGNEIVYDASLRSKSITINDTASNFNGGGHKNAAGIKGLSKMDLDNLLKELLKKVESK